MVALNPGRLFTFGCSFTQYHWPTWADILGRHWCYYRNWGQAGAGNIHMWCSLMECDQRYLLTESDTVVICLSGVMRFDRYVEGKWQNRGSVSNDPLFKKGNGYRSILDDRGFLIRDLAAIKSMITLLTHKRTSWKILAMQPILEVDYENRCIQAHDLCTLYQDVIQTILPSYVDVFGADGWKTIPGDGHPLPCEHLRYLDTVLPGWASDPAIRAWANDYDVADTQTKWTQSIAHRL